MLFRLPQYRMKKALLREQFDEKMRKKCGGLGDVASMLDVPALAVEVRGEGASATNQPGELEA